MKIAIIFTIAVLVTGVSIGSISAQSNYEIPSWVKGIAGFWADGNITDEEFGEGLTFLIDSGIIQIPKIAELENRITELENENTELRDKLSIPSQEEYLDYLESTLTISTDKKDYKEGEMIVISGRVSVIIGTTPITLQMFTDGNLVDIVQVGVSSSGSYSHRIIAEGPLWGKQSDYVVRVSYGVDTVAETNFSYTPNPTASTQDCSGTARCISGTVTKVIDGDTIKVDGQSIRFALASAPELGSYGSGVKETEFIQNICPVGSTALVDEDDKQTQGSYGRIIGVIYCNGLNLNSELLDSGLGYMDFKFCDISEFRNSDWAIKHGCDSKSDVSVGDSSTNNCDSSYPDFCIPPPPPDLDCGDISQKNFTVLQPDPHRFDGDKDGIGCES